MPEKGQVSASMVEMPGGIFSKTLNQEFNGTME